MARLLIFVGTRKALEAYDMAGVPILVRVYGPEKNAETIKAFAANPNGLLVAPDAFAEGWHAPDDTFVVFDASWRFELDNPLTVQARARVRREVVSNMPNSTREDMDRMQSFLNVPRDPNSLPVTGEFPRFSRDQQIVATTNQNDVIKIGRTYKVVGFRGDSVQVDLDGEKSKRKWWNSRGFEATSYRQ